MMNIGQRYLLVTGKGRDRLRVYQDQEVAIKLTRYLGCVYSLGGFSFARGVEFSRACDFGLEIEYNFEIRAVTFDFKSIHVA